ncbi:Aste57867_1432 [Aphanomyces stellatus]|uniref:Aste57867_1432 protein n=1 Tax=Aphanomyces stellatus TaxID=120398 RepID=A0A485K5M1_9STRA|nr:hypothetical protein As57867_001431 [Aphanomyces stellatus]VFT78649.1 Aste57867_1432 [Aphanomyces stellatus]
MTLRIPAAHSYFTLHDFAADAALIAIDLIEARAKTVAQKHAKTLQHRRVRSKLNQRRYRAEKKESNNQRLSTIAALQMEVARLEGRADALRMALPAHLCTFEPETHVMAEYFRLFAHGFKPDGCLHVIQQDFLASTMREDMVFMDDVGVEKLLTQWKAYTTIFDSFNMEVRSIDVVAFSPEVVVHADAIMRLRVSRLTIETLFRHLLGDECLTQRLIGRVLELPMQMRFAFDANMKVLRYDTHANIVLGLSQLLGSFEDTLSVLRHFQMRENAEIVNDQVLEY